MSELDLSKVLPGWQVEGVLGSGTFGTVYLIRQSEENGAFSALKVMKVPPQREAIDNAVKLGIGRDLLTTYFLKFKNDLTWELTMYRTVKSGHLAPVEELVTEDAMGPGWTGYLRTGIYTPMATYFEKAEATQEDAARLGTELASALDALTQYGMVHGEIKPENVLVTDAGGFVLLDFAVRRCLEKAGTGIFAAGDDSFEAPEVGEERKYTAQSDIYSLGALMCYVANGCHMPENRDPGLIKNIDPAFEAVIRRAMAASPDDRYQTAMQLKIDLAKLDIGKKPARRAMAAAAAFDAVKRNGGGAMAGSPKTARPPQAPKPAQSRQSEAKPQTAKSQTARSQAAKAQAAKPQAARSQTATAVREPAPEPRQKTSKSKAGYIIGALAALLIVAVIAVIWLPRGEDGTKVPNDDEHKGATIYPEGKDPYGNDNDSQGGENDPATPGEPTTPGGEDNPGEPTTPDGEDNPDGPTTPGGEDNPGEPTTPGGEDNPGEPTTPGGEDDPGEPTTPGGEDNPGTTTNPGGEDDPGTTATRPEAVNNDVLYPSDTKVMTRAELEGKTEDEVRMLINEIYARHGYIFGSATGSTQKYFNSQKWYSPVTSDSAKVVAQFNDTENKNMKLLTEYRAELRNASSDPEPTEPTPSEPTPSEPTPTEPTPSEPTPSEPTAKDNTYLFPLDTQLITAADLESRSKEEVYLIKNELFARHGYIFKNATYRDYFTGQQWYTPVTTDAEAANRMFNKTEQANLATIQDFIHSKGWE